MRVEVAYAGPEGEAIEAVDLPARATVEDALARSSVPVRFALDPAALSFAIFGEAARTATPLRDGDRIELLRPLVADPRDARRRRAAENPLPRPRPSPKRRRRAG